MKLSNPVSGSLTTNASVFASSNDNEVANSTFSIRFSIAPISFMVYLLLPLVSIVMSLFTSNTYGAYVISANSNELSIASGVWGDLAEFPSTSVKVESLFKNSLSILPR